MAREFAETMSELRKQRGVSQRTAAAELQISQALLSHYENGIREPGLDFIRRACGYYGVSADYLLGLSDSPAAPELGELLAELQRLGKQAEAVLEGRRA